MNLGHQRACSVDDLETSGLAGFAHRRRYTMGRVNDTLPCRNFLNLVNKNRALFRQLIDHKAVVDDLTAHVNGRAKGIEGDLYDIDRADNAGAEAAGFEQQDTLLAGKVICTAKVGDGF